jgi:hypothetical protein
VALRLAISTFEQSPIFLSIEREQKLRLVRSSFSRAADWPNAMYFVNITKPLTAADQSADWEKEIRTNLSFSSPPIDKKIGL